MLGKKSENLKRYIAVMSVLRGYPRVAAIVLLFNIYAVADLRVHIIQYEIPGVERASATKRPSGQKSVFCCVVLGYDIVERGKG